MFKIGDFSKLSLVSVKTLRYYDEIGLLKPKRVDTFSGYRYYSANQLARLNRIIALKNFGLSLDEITRLLSGDVSLDAVLEIVHEKQAEIKDKLKEEADRLERVEEWLRRTKRENKMPEYEVVIKKVEPQKIVSLRRVIENHHAVGTLWGELCTNLGKNNVEAAGPPMEICHDKEYKPADNDVEVAVPIKEDFTTEGGLEIRELEGHGTVLTTIHHGSYDKLKDAYQFMMGWMEQNGYRLIAADREVYLTDPGKVKPEENITEIQLPVEKV